jgi:RNA polymerase sigma-70 factor (ECF subfamily)
MIQTEATNRTDAELIAAIREGDRDLFRKLVERHGATVFGIAWSRLGDRALAEEAAQVTFINAYKRLGLLRTSEKFGAWLAAIARHAAINLGISHRREIEKRERWRLEASPVEESSDESELTDETLRQSLADLPPVHRESLVMFYLEGKSVAEAATALGISETAFKTRLHRARAFMRSALEARLESSLEKLRPSQKFAAGVMLGLPAQSPGTILGGGFFAVLLKGIPAAWTLMIIQYVALIPGLVLGLWVAKKERKNFVEPDGFRARNMDRMLRSAVLIVPALMMAIFFGIQPIGIETIYPVLLVVFAIPIQIWTVRRTRLLTNRLVIVECINAVLLIIVLAVLHFGWPPYWGTFAVSGMMLLLSVTTARIYLRMDESLFLRATERLLTHEGPSGLDGRRPYSRKEIFRFAQFLARKNLVLDWRWRADELRLKLMPVTPRPSLAFFPYIWTNASELSIDPSGQVRSKLGKRDARDLRGLKMNAQISELNAAVSISLAAALHAFAANDLKTAAACLGEVSKEQIYRIPPERSAAVLWRTWIFRVCAVPMLVLGIFSYNKHWSGWKQSLQTVNLTEEQFKANLKTLVAGAGTNEVQSWQFRVFMFPERKYFSPNALAIFHEPKNGS